MATNGSVLTEDVIKDLNRNVLSVLWKSTTPDLDKVDSILQDILRTTEEYGLSNSHRAASCDALCGLLRHGASSESSELRSLCHSQDTWKRVLSMYFDRFSDARARPLKQVLETLVRLLQGMHAESGGGDSKSCLEYSRTLCVDYLGDLDDIARARPAISVLELLHAKRLVKASKLVESMQRKEVAKLDCDLTDEEAFVYLILLWARNSDIAPICGRFLASICSELLSAPKPLEPDSELSVSTVWVRPVRRLIQEYPGAISVFEQEILPGLLRADKNASLALLHHLPFVTLLRENTMQTHETDIRLCLLLIRINQESHFVDFDEVLEGSAVDTGVTLSTSERISANMLRHTNADIRLTALTILTAPKMTARPLSKDVLLLLERHIWDFLEDTDARVRNDYLSLLRRLFTKLESIAVRLSKIDSGVLSSGGKHVSKAWPVDEGPETRELLSENVRFLGTYVSRISDELVPTASYQRHILALKALTYIYKLSIPGSVIKLLPGLKPSKWLTRTLFDLVMDPFDDVRATAAALVFSFDPNDSIVNVALTNAERLMRDSGRADQADGFGRLFDGCQRYKATLAGKDSQGLISNKTLPVIDPGIYKSATDSLMVEIERLIEVARADLEKAIADAPLHGKIIALKYMLSSHVAEILISTHGDHKADVSSKTVVSNDDSLVDGGVAAHVLKICADVWNVVRPILCDDSPEGASFLGDEDDDATDLGVKDTLSYAWRALKESSLLLRSMMALACKSSGIDSQVMKSIGKLLFLQLAELRHRGAFSAVAQTFAAFCSHCVAAKSPDIRSLVEQLYEDTLACIQAKATALTRRSAGLPALIVGLLGAHTSSPLTARGLQDLQQISQRPVGSGITSELPQVHALNCLKDILTNTKLGPATESHLSKILIIAVECLDKDLWAIRNSGLMLLKALLLRLEDGRANNNAQNQSSRRGRFSRTAHTKHPALADVVLNLLMSAAPGSDSDASSPQQERLVEKTFPAIEVIERVGVPASIEDEVKSLLSKHLRSPVWAMRKKAAGCLALLMERDEILKVCEQAAHGKSSNELHGILLLVRHALREQRFNSNVEDLAGTFLDQWLAYVTNATSSSIHELYHENMIIMLRTGGAESVLARYLELCQQASADEVNEEDSMFRGMAYAVTRKVASHNSQLDPLSVLQQFLPQSAAISAALASLSDRGALTIDEAFHYVAANHRSLVTRLKPEALATLIQFLTSTMSSTVLAQIMHASSEPLSEMTAFSQHLLRHGSDAQVFIHLVKFWGVLSALFWRCRDVKLHEPNSYLSAWYQMLCNCMGEQTDVDVREAAIDSILQFVKSVEDCDARTLTVPTVLPLIFVVYDGLIDDDEDIRLKSADIASWLRVNIEPTMAEGGTKLSPAAARSELVKLLSAEATGFTVLAHESLKRVLGCEPEQLEADSFLSKLQLAEEKSTTLFDEEKQNLFIDEYREARDWAWRSRRYATTSSSLEGSVLVWARTGAETLLNKLDTGSTAAFLGPLGTLSRPDIFLLVARLFLASGTVLRSTNSLRNAAESVSSLRVQLTRVAGQLDQFDCLLSGFGQELRLLLGDALAFPQDFLG